MRLVLLLVAATLTLWNGSCCLGFAPQGAALSSRRHHHHHPQSVSIIRRNAMNSDEEDSTVRARNNDARTDVRNLLTQCAVQSFMYLSETLRDPHSGKWIEEFLDTKNQLNYHGTGASYMERFGGSWEGPLLAMMEQPKDVVVVSAKRSGKGHRGWSKNNPYLEDRYVEFDIDIDPVSLATRILSVREQIAKEWETDLDVLREANEGILDSHFKLAKLERTKKDDALVSSPPSSFERTATALINEHTAFQSGGGSPFRKGNFDLLYNICTQASVHRVLRDLKDAGSDEDIPFAWLREFYSDRVADYFDGDQKFGRADDFMDDLLSAPPSFVNIPESSKRGLADPMALAEKIIATRSKVAQEWKDIVANVPQDHIDGIRPILLSKQMESWGQSNGPLGGGGGNASGGFQ
jgi:hypothetical protein